MTELDLELSAPAPASGPVDTGLRELLRVPAPSVAILTGRDPGGRPWGWTADWFAALSFDPATIVVSLPGAAATGTHPEPGRAVLLNLLSGDQSMADRGAGPYPMSDAPAQRFTVDGIPVITGATCAARCRVDAVHPAGDRRLVVARVERVRTNPAGSPLVALAGAAAASRGREPLEAKEPT